MLPPYPAPGFQARCLGEHSGVDEDLSFSGEPAARIEGLVTLASGATFCVSGRSGDILPQAAQGLFFQDTRVLSFLRLRIDGNPLEVLTVLGQDPTVRTVLARVPPRGHETELILERTRVIGDGLSDTLRLRNLSRGDVHLALTVDLAADFADLFAVKEGRVAGPADEVSMTITADALELARRDGDARLAVRISAEGGAPHPGGLRFAVTVPAHGAWSTCLHVRPLHETPEALAEVAPEAVTPDARAAERPASHIVPSDTLLGRTLRQSIADLRSLRIVDPRRPGHVGLAAGLPWFMALFGRDSLIASAMALHVDPSLALGTVRALAGYQGTEVVPATEEEPGRILHERRLGRDFPLVHGGGSTYYGSVDATPLFVLVVGELVRWGALPADRLRAELLGPVDRALAWIDDYGDRDGDGFVEYQRATPHGLRNQGWKDSHDSIAFADGTLAETPIALAEVQGYVYAAQLARADIAHLLGEERDAAHWRERAAVTKQQFNERFWLPERGTFAIALDGDKRPVDALASNLGHCLWTGIVDHDKAPAVAERLMAPDMFTGWGIRTLSSTMTRYNPMSYHNGSVWPHDTALAAGGLMRYGHVEQAQQLATALLEAATGFDQLRLPELFSGFDRHDYPGAPVPFPTSCSPQAWAAATPVFLVQMLLRLHPDTFRKQDGLQPAWPAELGRLTVDGVRIGAETVSITVDSGYSDVVSLAEASA